MYARFFIGNQILYKIQQTKSFEKEILDIGVYNNYIRINFKSKLPIFI